MDSEKAKNTKQSREEYMEVIWYLLEKGDLPVTLKKIEKRRGSPVNYDDLMALEEDGLIAIKTGGKDESGEEGSDTDSTPEETWELAFTEKGKERARLLIRSHRLAERLIHDVLGGDYETGACEFEHIIDIGLVNSICTMLGHPRECPHGLPIPEGECCRQSADAVRRAVVPLTSLEIGQSAKIAYVYSKSDQQLHIIEGMQIKPGVIIRLHQKFPTFVVEVEDMNVAMDDEIASNIQVWKESLETTPSFQSRRDERQTRGGGRGKRKKRGFFKFDS